MVVSSLLIISLEFSKTCLTIKISLLISANIDSDGFDLPGINSISTSYCLSESCNLSGFVEDLIIVKSNLIDPAFSSDFVIKLIQENIKKY